MTLLRFFILLLLSLCLMACASRPFSDTQATDHSGLLYGQFVSPAALPADNPVTIEQLDADDRVIARQTVAIAADGSFHVIAAAPGSYRITTPAHDGTRPDKAFNGNVLLLDPGELYFIGSLGVGPGGTVEWRDTEGDDFVLLARVRSHITDAAWRNRVDYELDQRER